MSMSINKHDQMVMSMRSYLRNLANRRNSGIVTADDANVYLTRMGIGQWKTRTRLSLINSAFIGGSFEANGSIPSNREVAKGRRITEWTVTA